VARYGKRQIESLMKNAGIIRNEAKSSPQSPTPEILKSGMNSAALTPYLRFVGGKPIVHRSSG
jgi:hypothetical protein